MRGATVDEMRMILASYECDEDNIFVGYYQHPESSYYPEDVEAEYELVRKMLKDLPKVVKSGSEEDAAGNDKITDDSKDELGEETEMAEYWDLYDKDRQPLGRTHLRGDCIYGDEFDSGLRR